MACYRRRQRRTPVTTSCYARRPAAARRSPPSCGRSTASCSTRRAIALRDEVSVLYVSPLKALANDIRLNLEEPLHGVRDVGAESGLDLSRIRAGLRTGDTSASERTAMLRRPPHILVTTPESLFILLTSPKFREKLASVRHVIVDELHALAGNKRGAHLALTLERLERFVTSRGNARPNRIGLSATLNPIEKLAGFLAGYDVARDNTRTPRPIKIVRADDRVRAMDLQVIAPGPELGPLATHPHWEAMYDEVARLIGEHRTTLVFTLSRRHAERVAINLQKRLGTDAVMAHHGSLARAERLLAEQRLKRGELKAIVATASLELGIDVGAVDLVCQLDTPKSISAAIQRIGRSGHSLGATPKGRFFALTTDDLARMRRGGPRDSPRPSRRSRNPDGMRRHRRAANRRDRRRRRRNLRGRSAARPPQRVQLRRSRRRQTASSPRTAGRRIARTNNGRGAENFLRSRQRSRPPAPLRATVGNHLRRNHPRSRQLRRRDRIRRPQNRRRRRGLRAGVVARRRFFAGLDAVADSTHLARTPDGRSRARDGADAAVLADRSGRPLACDVGRD